MQSACTPKVLARSFTRNIAAALRKEALSTRPWASSTRWELRHCPFASIGCRRPRQRRSATGKGQQRQRQPIIADPGKGGRFSPEQVTPLQVNAAAGSSTCSRPCWAGDKYLFQTPLTAIQLAEQAMGQPRSAWYASILRNNSVVKILYVAPARWQVMMV